MKSLLPAGQLQLATAQTMVAEAGSQVNKEELGPKLAAIQKVGSIAG